MKLDKKSRNGDTLGPVELIVWPEKGNQGDWREQDGQGEVSIIIFGMSKSSGFQKYNIWWVFRHFVFVFVFVVVFVIVSKSPQNMVCYANVRYVIEVKIHVNDFHV